MTRRRLVASLAIGAGALALVAIGVVVAQRVGVFLRVPPPRPFEAITLKKLTDTGRVRAAAISPDGRYLAYAQVRLSLDSGQSINHVCPLRQGRTGSAG